MAKSGRITDGSIPVGDLPAHQSYRKSAGSEQIDVVVVDDHQLFRTGLAEVLAREGLNVVGTAADGDAALKLVVETAPDVVLMDLEMPGLSGVETTREISRTAPRTHVVVLTVSAEEQSVFDAIAAGASGYLLKGTSLESLVAAIKAAAAGESLISAAVAMRLFERLQARTNAAPGGLGLSNLSGREIEILMLVARGRRNSEIAEELVISPHTVRNHISNILAKLQMANRVEAAAYAIKHGVV